MYKDGDLGKCTFPEFDAAKSTERGGSDAKSETENLTQLTLFHHHITHTHSHTFSISFSCTKGQPQRERMNSHSPGFCGLVGRVLSWFHLCSLKQLHLAGRWPHLRVWQLLFAFNWGQLGSPSCDLTFTSHSNQFPFRPAIPWVSMEVMDPLKA